MLVTDTHQRFSLAMVPSSLCRVASKLGDRSPTHELPVMLLSPVVKHTYTLMLLDLASLTQ